MSARPVWLSYGYALVVAATLGYFLLRIPIQVTDSFTNMLALGRPFEQVVRESFGDREYLRPGLWAGLKLVYDLSGGEYFYWYRATQALQVAAVLVLFVTVLRPRTPAALTVLPLAVAALVGSHTFAWTVREAFPINTFLTILVCCAAAAALVFAARRWWSDVAAGVLFLVSALTVESGLLVAVIFAGGYLVGLRGVSRAGVIAVVALCGAYFWLRFGILSVGTPGLTAREAGFGFARYGPSELVAMFGERPVFFYGYNVISSVMGVLFAEPRDGVWRFTSSLLQRRPDPVLALGVVSSTLATVLIGRFAWSRRKAWLAGTFHREDQIVLLFAFVAAANAAISYAYTKDVIMSPAGFFFAAALFVACRDLVERLPRVRPAVYAMSLVTLAVLSGTWGMRQIGIHAGLARTAVDVREQWAYVDETIAGWGYKELPPDALALKNHLQDDALVRHPSPALVRERWTRLFEID